MIKICSALIEKNGSRVSLLTEGVVFFYKYRADALHRVEAKRKRDGTAKKTLKPFVVWLFFVKYFPTYDIIKENTGKR